MIANFKCDGCVACGESEPCCLTIHHLEPECKKFSLSPSVLIRSKIPLSAINRELACAVVLCGNCHQKLHAGKLELL